LKIQILPFGLVSFLLFGCALVPTSYPPLPFLHEFKTEPRPSVPFSEENAKFFAGFAKRTITPETTQWLSGKAPRRGTKTHGDLWARCLVLRDQEGNSVAIASLDLLGLMPSDSREIQERVKSFFKGKVLIHSTHTHSAPDTMGLWGPRLFYLIPVRSGRNETYMNTLKEKVVGCISDAVDREEPALISFVQDTLEGIARGPRDMQNDESFFIMQILTKKERILLLNFAVHPETIKQIYVTADFLQYVYDRLGRASGSEVVYINGAIGGVQPKGLPGKINEWNNAHKLAATMIEKSLAVLPDAKVSVSGQISWSSETAWIKLENKFWKLAIFLGLLPEERDKKRRIPVELNYLRIGDAGIITFPGEVFPNIAVQLKTKMPDRYKLTFGLINGELGYFLLSNDVKSGKYKYHSRVSLGPNVGDKIFEALDALIHSGRK